MIELPESVTFGRQMKETLCGKIISEVIVEQSPHRFAFFKGDKTEYPDKLEGERVVDAGHHGGYIELMTEHFLMTFGDGSYPRYYEEPSKYPKKHQLLLRFDDDTAVAVCIQMYGAIGLFEKGKIEDEYYQYALDRPDGVSDQLTFERFRKLYTGNKMSVKAFLATEQRIPGLGNGVFQDIVWKAGLDPRYPMQDMTEEDWKRLYQSMKEVLHEMIDRGARNTEKDFYGNPGGYIVQMSKNSLMEPCIRCGTEVQKTNYMGGTIYFCSKCQKK